MRKGKDPDPDPYLRLMDPDTGGPATCGSGSPTLVPVETICVGVLVVLANKQDIEGAMSVTEVHGALGLDKLKNRTFQIFKVMTLLGKLYCSYPLKIVLQEISCR
jgi:hypothetical protein